MALCIERGDGVARDKSRAILLYREAAQAGVDDACCALGYCLASDAFRDLEATDPRCLEDGRLALDEAVVWLRHAADRGSGEAMVHLGQIYERGGGSIRRDSSAALALFCKAAEWDPKAAFYAGNILWDQLRDGVGSIDKCIEYYELAANGGVADAQNALGVIYEDGWGQGLPMSVPKAQAWFKLAADNGHAIAAYNLAALLERVLDLNVAGTEVDPTHRGKINSAIEHYYARAARGSNR
eukprot:CAMPEP_0205919298 /NCGR_PEP_ID=MMETSP1325-20131115/10356_1 /ASSEMBLY_ACC=CAM_ASM_000708 /TAXON_ID=236786 /ORGANISM="Florenciella sp., Strain RCC1007" /LENGTH=239 /DNA_ID=CAMNT_0053286889 /DNA_START=54 /DNA_END=773 /DNA_ORIENTATION=+